MDNTNPIITTTTTPSPFHSPYIKFYQIKVSPTKTKKSPPTPKT